MWELYILENYDQNIITQINKVVDTSSPKVVKVVCGGKCGSSHNKYQVMYQTNDGQIYLVSGKPQKYSTIYTWFQNIFGHRGFTPSEKITNFCLGSRVTFSVGNKIYLEDQAGKCEYPVSLGSPTPKTSVTMKFSIYPLNDNISHIEDSTCNYMEQLDYCHLYLATKSGVYKNFTDLIFTGNIIQIAAGLDHIIVLTRDHP